MTEFIQIIKDLPEIWKSVITIIVFALLFFIYNRVNKVLSAKKQVAIEDGANIKKTALSTIKSNVKLIDTDDETAAVIMAIVSEKMGVPLKNLEFKSIKCLSESPVLSEVSDEEAAVVMAITSHMTKTPLQNLSFKSIKQINCIIPERNVNK